MNDEAVEKVTEQGLFRGVYKDLQLFGEFASCLSRDASANFVLCFALKRFLKVTNYLCVFLFFPRKGS
jgi:hypothetical protein